MHLTQKTILIEEFPRKPTQCSSHINVNI